MLFSLAFLSRANREWGADHQTSSFSPLDIPSVAKVYALGHYDIFQAFSSILGKKSKKRSGP